MTAAEPSCIDVTEVSLVTRAVHAMWRAAYENEALDRLSDLLLAVTGEASHGTAPLG